MATTQTRSKKGRGGPPSDSAAGVATNGVSPTGPTTQQNGTPRDSSPEALGLDAEAMIALYRKMVGIRFFEDGAQRGFRRGKIGGYLHVYSGQEAVATGFLSTYEPGDRAITAYRDHAHAILMGSDPKEVMAELFGRGTGLVKGKGGSMHLFDEPNGMMGGYGIVGGHIPLGVGMAYAQRYQGTSGITQLYLGDGAIHNGAFHEAANLSGLWGRDGLNPCLFIIENNQYGMGTSVERATAMTDLASKFDSYAIPHEKVDGMDLLAVVECARRVVAHIRETGQPYAVEAMTYRLVPHGAGDFFEKYRTKEEVAEWRKRDPIGILEEKIVSGGMADDEALDAIRTEIREGIDAILQFADESPEPAIEELYTDVYAE